MNCYPGLIYYFKFLNIQQSTSRHSGYRSRFEDEKPCVKTLQLNLGHGNVGQLNHLGCVFQCDPQQGSGSKMGTKVAQSAGNFWQQETDGNRHIFRFSIGAVLLKIDMTILIHSQQLHSVILNQFPNRSILFCWRSHSRWLKQRYQKCHPIFSG